MVFPLKPPFSYGFPMVFLWFSYGFPIKTSNSINSNPRSKRPGFLLLAEVKELTKAILLARGHISVLNPGCADRTNPVQ